MGYPSKSTRPRPPDLLTLAECAGELYRCVETVRRWHADHKFKAIRIGRTILVPRSELERLKEESLS